MNSHIHSGAQAAQRQSSRSPLISQTLLLALFSLFSLSGCTGLTGAGTNPSNSSTKTDTTASVGTLAANATSFNFGNVPVGSNASQTLTLTNTGAAAVTISQANMTGAGFSIAGGMSSVSIAAGQMQAFQIQFVPTSTGSVTGAITLASNATNSPMAISLSGAGMTDVAITSQPANQSVVAGHTANFSVVATGNGTLSYQWKKNGAVVGGATSASYTTTATMASDNGAQFAVVVTDSTGSVTSNAATLTVTSAPVAPSITTQPANQTVTAGKTATFSVTATGTATLTYQWKKNGAVIGGATSASYTTPATGATDNGAQFTVTVTNGTGNVTSSPATLTVDVPPAITTQPANQAVTAGKTATFSVTASGSGTLSYRWNKNGTVIGGATAASYTTPSTIASDNGAVFTVTVTDSVASVTSSAATLTVNVPPSITAQPANKTVSVGQTASFGVAASGTATLSYQWSKNGSAISGATAASYTTPATSASDNGAQFTVVVTNSFGSVTSGAATLTVNAPPSITTQPASQTVTAGQAAKFSVTASSAGTPTYQWSKNGNVIGGATSASYTTPATTAADNGSKFSVTVTDSTGSVTSSAATLTVNVPPTVTSQPVSQTVIAGQTATFSVSATGTATLTYQWKKNGTAIVGATSSSYTTPATATTDNGAQFTVTVTNSAGNVTSNAAILTVNAATRSLIASQTALNFSIVNLGSSSILGVTFTNAGNTSITVSGVSIAGPGFMAAGVSSGLILAPGQTATLNVTFAPASAGSVTGSATVTSNATNSPSTISLSGTGVQPVSHSVTLTWTASASAVSGYNVYRSTESGGPYTKLNSSLVATNSYMDATVQAGQTYYYVVTSVTAGGVESAYSAEVSATIP